MTFLGFYKMSLLRVAVSSGALQCRKDGQVIQEMLIPVRNGDAVWVLSILRTVYTSVYHIDDNTPDLYSFLILC